MGISITFTSIHFCYAIKKYVLDLTMDLHHNATKPGIFDRQAITKINQSSFWKLKNYSRSKEVQILITSLISSKIGMHMNSILSSLGYLCILNNLQNKAPIDTYSRIDQQNNAKDYDFKGNMPTIKMNSKRSKKKIAIKSQLFMHTRPKVNNFSSTRISTIDNQ